MFCITETLCFSYVALFVALAVIVGVVAAILTIRNGSGDEGEGIQTTNMDFQKIQPDVDSSDVDTTEYEEEETSEHPYLVDEVIFAGEYLDHGVRLKILFYIEEDDEHNPEVHCEPIVECPVGATDVTVDHTWEGDYPLGMAIINYMLGSTAKLVRIGLSNQALEECNYNVVIEAAQSTNDNITE